MKLLRVLLAALVSVAFIVTGCFAFSSPAHAASKPLPPGSFALSQHRALTRAATAADDNGTICYYGACYDYVSGRQYADASGASARFWRARPELDAANIDGHSLQELAIQSADGSQIVEIGWTVDRGLNGDSAPHLFVFHWVDGQPTCYNTCDFTRTSDKIVPGMKLPSGGYTTLQINHVADRWELSMDGTVFGYFADSLWQGRFTRLGLVQAFGEVAAMSEPTCTDMGTGKFANSAASSSITGFRLLGSTTPVDLSMLVTSPAWYSSGSVTPSSFRLGGPGAGRC